MDMFEERTYPELKPGPRQSLGRLSGRGRCKNVENDKEEPRTPKETRRLSIRIRQNLGSGIPHFVSPRNVETPRPFYISESDHSDSKMQGEDLPYKSHVRPACLPCRRRKSRCKIESHSTACLMCRAHGTECSFPAEKRRKTAPRTPKKKNNHESPSKAPALPTETSVAPSIGLSDDTTILPHSFTSPATTTNLQRSTRAEWGQPQNIQETPLSLEAEDDNPHIVGPAVIDDSHVLADYLSAFSGSRGIRSIHPMEPGSSSSPIVFTKVQKRPVGMILNSNPALHKLQIVEKLIEPWSSRMVDLYVTLDKVD